MAKSKYDERTEEELTKLRNEVETQTYNLISCLCAWRYCLAWLSSFTRVLDTGNGLEDIQLNIAQRDQFAFSYNPKKSEHFGLVIQSPDFNWIRDINIKYATLTDDGLILYIDELKKNGFYIASLAIKIPFADIHRSILVEAKAKVKNLWLIRLDNINGNLSLKELHRTPIRITDKPYTSIRTKKRRY